MRDVAKHQRHPIVRMVRPVPVMVTQAPFTALQPCAHMVGRLAGRCKGVTSHGMALQQDTFTNMNGHIGADVCALLQHGVMTNGQIFKIPPDQNWPQLFDIASKRIAQVGLLAADR